MHSELSSECVKSIYEPIRKETGNTIEQKTKMSIHKSGFQITITCLKSCLTLPIITDMLIK